MSLPRPFARIEAGRYICSDGTPSHFTTAELSCRCGCGRKDMDQRTIDMIEKIRRQFGVPVFPNSGIRCEAHNRIVGGKDLSQHLPRSESGVIVYGTRPGGAGRAVDFNLKGYSTEKVYRILDRAAIDLGVVGLGKYPGFVHADTRTGGPARW